jgi:hypothetical protein
MTKIINKKSFLIPLIIAIVILAIGGYMFYIYQQGCMGCNDGDNLRKFATTTTEVSDWKTYKNEKYGFEMKYPASWTFNNGGNSAIYFDIKGQEYLFSIGVSSRSDWAKYLNGYFGSSRDLVYLAENDQYIFTWSHVYNEDGARTTTIDPDEAAVKTSFKLIK